MSNKSKESAKAADPAVTEIPAVETAVNSNPASDSMVADLDSAPASPAVVTVTAPAEEAEEEQAGGVVKVANADDALSGEKARVTFYEQDGPGGKEPIFASLNGYAYHIPRNVQVDLPVEVLAIFENANETRIEMVEGKPTERIIKRFSYQVHGMLAKRIAA